MCLSSSPSNEKIIRTAAQMAQAFQAGFTALYVQTAEKTEKTPEDLARLQKHVRLAEQSGAEIVTTHSEDIALQIAEYARISEVTRIVIGKSMMKQGYFHQRRVWTERLTDLVPDLEIHIIPDSDVYRRYQKRKKFPEWMELPSWKELMLTVLILAAATGIGEIFFRLGFTDANIITVYLFGVMLTSILTSGYTCSVVSSVASVVLFNYYDRAKAFVACVWFRLSGDFCDHAWHFNPDQYACFKIERKCKAFCTRCLSNQDSF